MKKSIIYKCFLLVGAFILFVPNVYAEELDFCVQTAAIWQLLGYAILALKIIVPVILIILGSIDFAKAVINAKDDSLSKAAGMFLRRILIGIFIFFIPTIVSVIFNSIASASESLQAGEACNTCLNNPRNSACDGYKATAKAYRSTY
jgi:large-conductance mechanosensitive channel